MQKFNPIVADLVRGISFSIKHTETKGDTIKTTKAASNLAVVYEAARNAVEFRSEHLIRQSAIVRILKRRLFLRQASGKIAPLLIRELIWARYLKDDAVSVNKNDEIEKIVNKYRDIISLSKDAKLRDWLFDLAGCEIEENLVFNPYPQLLINFTSQCLQTRISIEDEVDEKMRDIQVYIAVERGFAINSEIFITYHLLKAIMPVWFDQNVNSEELLSKLLEVKKEIDMDLSYPLASDIKREIVKQAAPFNLLREMVIREPDVFMESLKDKDSMNNFATQMLNSLYQENQGKVMRASTRSIVYIFLTKMVFGMAVELPYDFLVGRTNNLALIINLVFPPMLMFLLNLGVDIPNSANTKRIIEKINDYFYNGVDLKITTIGKRQKAINVFERIFLGIYSILFVGVFVFVIWVLNLLHFSIVSKAIFLFFLCVVSFFAYRVRSISKDYAYQEQKEGFLSSLIDFLFLPIVKVGQWLSGQIARLNFLGFIFDFIIEAPLKVFLEVVEEWIRFVRNKKEEIFTEG